jgi:hypothetical protein
MIPLTVPEIKRLLAEVLVRPDSAGTPPTGLHGDAVSRPGPAGSTSARLNREYSLVS